MKKNIFILFICFSILSFLESCGNKDHYIQGENKNYLETLEVKQNQLNEVKDKIEELENKTKTSPEENPELKNLQKEAERLKAEIERLKKLNEAQQKQINPRDKDQKNSKPATSSSFKKENFQNLIINYIELSEFVDQNGDPNTSSEIYKLILPIIQNAKNLLNTAFEDKTYQNLKTTFDEAKLNTLIQKGKFDLEKEVELTSPYGNYWKNNSLIRKKYNEISTFDYNPIKTSLGGSFTPLLKDNISDADKEAQSCLKVLNGLSKILLNTTIRNISSNTIQAIDVAKAAYEIRKNIPYDSAKKDKDKDDYYTKINFDTILKASIQSANAMKKIAATGKEISDKIKLKNIDTYVEKFIINKNNELNEAQNFAYQFDNKVGNLKSQENKYEILLKANYQLLFHAIISIYAIQDLERKLTELLLNHYLKSLYELTP